MIGVGAVSLLLRSADRSLALSIPRLVRARKDQVRTDRDRQAQPGDGILRHKNLMACSLQVQTEVIRRTPVIDDEDFCHFAPYCGPDLGRVVQERDLSAGLARSPTKVTICENTQPSTTEQPRPHPRALLGLADVVLPRSLH